MALSKATTVSYPESSQAQASDHDIALVSKAQQGDLDAFDVLTLRHRERLMSAIYNMTRLFVPSVASKASLPFSHGFIGLA